MCLNDAPAVVMSQRAILFKEQSSLHTTQHPKLNLPAGVLKQRKHTKGVCGFPGAHALPKRVSTAKVNTAPGWAVEGMRVAFPKSPKGVHGFTGRKIWCQLENNRMYFLLFKSSS